MDDNWTLIMDTLQDVGNHARGFYARCPRCRKESTRGKAAFLMIFKDSVFKSYSCYSCHFRGAGNYGMRALAKELGIQINAIQKQNKVKDKIINPDPIVWPPAWIKETDEVIEAGLAYLTERGVSHSAVNFYGLYFSETIDIGNDGPYITRYPCIIAPHTGLKGEVYGWSAREIPSLKAPLCQRPKSYMANGQNWKSLSAFGLEKLNEDAPVTLVEGFFDTLATPNSISVGGKDITPAHLRLMSQIDTKTFILALDADVQDENPDFIKSLILGLANLIELDVHIYALDWDKIRRALPGLEDPGSVGRRDMTEIIKDIEGWCL